MISKETLIEEYLVKKKPMHQIAEEKEIAVGTVYNYIKKFGIESRKAITEETKRKISEKLKGRPSLLKGIKRNEETKRKISEAKKGKYAQKTEFGGHKKARTDGYIAVYCPTHKNCSKDGYVMEHILIMEKHIGRHLAEDEVVHHINKIRNDNRIENLKLMTFREHARFHMKERYEKKKGMMTYQ